MARHRRHRYAVTVRWSGNRGAGTASYRAYARDHEIEAAGKPPIRGSSDPAFAGDATRWNPEEMLLAALSTCHQLWYLHLAAAAGIVVTAYTDQAEGLMEERPDGSGSFVEAVLRPRVTVAAGTAVAQAEALHRLAHEKCFIANSVNFPVSCAPQTIVAA